MSWNPNENLPPAGGTEVVAPPCPPSVIPSVPAMPTLFDTCPHLDGQDDDRNRLDLALELERPTLPKGGVDGGLARGGIGDQQLAGTGRRCEAGGRVGHVADGGQLGEPGDGARAGEREPG